MKKISRHLKIISVVLLFAFRFVNPAWAGDGDQGIKFRQITLQQALEAAKVENKPVFVHGFADWCHYCMYMRDSVYTNKEVGDFFNANFICIKIDMEKEGKMIRDTLNAHTYPELFFFDTNGEMMHRGAGRRYKSTFMELGREALDPRRQMRTYKKDYESGKASPEQVQQYFRMQEMCGMNAQQMLNDYLMKQPDSSFVSSWNNWKILLEIWKDPSMPLMKRFLGNKKAFEAIHTADSVNNKLIGMFNTYLLQFVQQLDSNSYEISKKNILRMNGLEIGEKICAYADLNKMKMKSDWPKYKEESKIFIQKYAMDDPKRLYDISNVYYETFNSDKQLLKTAEPWVIRSISLSDRYKSNYLLACISYLLDEKDQALKAANHAIELGKKEGVDYSQATQILARIEKMP